MTSTARRVAPPGAPEHPICRAPSVPSSPGPPPHSYLGMARTGSELPAAVLASEMMILLVTGVLSLRAPVSINRRLGRVRQGLARMEQGDFTVRLPSRSMDDIGFLSASVDSMGRTVGSVVRAIQAQAEARPTPVPV